MQGRIGPVVGYRSWNDLLGNSGGEPGYVNPSAWSEASAPGVAAALGIPMEAAREALITVAVHLSPVMERARWNRRREAIAANLATLCISVTPFSEGDRVGFTAQHKSRDVPAWVLPGNAETILMTVDTEGDVQFSSTFEKVEDEGPRYSIRLARFLEAYSRRTEKVQPGIEETAAYKSILTVLERMDAKAMDRMQFVKVFANAEYDAFRKLEVSPGFEDFVRRQPFFSGLLQALAMAHTAYLEGTTRMWNLTMPDLESVEDLVAGRRGNGMEGVVDLVTEHIEKYMTWMPVDRDAISKTMNAVALFEPSQYRSLRPRYLAILSFCPPKLLATLAVSTPLGLDSLIERLVKDWQYDAGRMDYRLVFDEIGTQFGGDITAFSEDLHQMDNTLNASFFLMARTLVDRLRFEVKDMPVAKRLGQNAFERISDAMLPYVARGTRYIRLGGRTRLASPERVHPRHGMGALQG